MKYDPYYAQKHIEKENRDRVVKAVYENPMTFTQLKNKLGLSKPVLSKHLKFLREQGIVEKAFINDRVVYRPTKGALKLPLLHTLIFEDGAYSRITGELSRERKDYIGKETVLHQDKEKREAFMGLEIKPQVIKEKSESEIIQAIDKWLTPIVLYAIIQELKTGDEWTKSVNGVVQKLMELIKQKDLGKFEKALREKYSKTLVQKYFSIFPEKRIPLINSLDGIIKHVKTHEFIEEDMRRKGFPPFEKVGSDRKGVKP